MSHPNSSVTNYINKNLTSLDNIELLSCSSKESIVFDEKETSWIYDLALKGKDIKLVLTLSDPLYFCSVSIVKSEKEHFNFKSYLKNIDGDSSIENLFNKFIDEEINEETYTIEYLKILEKNLLSGSILNVLSGNVWPAVPHEETPLDDLDDF